MSDYSVTVELRAIEGARQFALQGRVAWALMQLLQAGKRGCTPIENPAPRWSAYVHELRNLGFAIETHHEPHGGAFPGTHARYELVCDVRLVEVA